MQESMYGLLLSVEMSGDDLVLKLDLTGDTVNHDFPQPVLKLTFAACLQAPLAEEMLKTYVGLALEIVPTPGAESTRLDLYFDAHDPHAADPDLALTCADWRLKRTEFTAADLAAKSQWQDRTY